MYIKYLTIRNILNFESNINQHKRIFDITRKINGSPFEEKIIVPSACWVFRTISLETFFIPRSNCNPLKRHSTERAART